MHPHPILTVGPSIRTEGPVGLAQGVYGARGNLELVACDARDGLWVFWFNADRDTDPLAAPDVPPGTWSAGLHFAPGVRYRDAQIVQSVLGPDHLEVLALAEDGVLQSWFWSPGPGFQRRGSDAAAGVSAFHLAHRGGELAVTADGRHLRSTAEGYPERSWVPAPEGPGPVPDATGAVIAAGVPRGEIAPGTARAIRSTRAGGTVELVWRGADGRLRHLGVPD